MAPVFCAFFGNSKDEGLSVGGDDGAGAGAGGRFLAERPQKRWRDMC